MKRRVFLKKTLIIFPFLLIKNFSFYFFGKKKIFYRKFKKHIWILGKNDF